MSGGDVVQYFDDVAVTFTSKYGNKQAFRHRLRVCTEAMRCCLANLKGQLSALDVGCGSGVFSGWLAERGCKVTAIDQSSAMLSLARANARARNVAPLIDFILSAAPTPALEDTHADIVLCFSVLEYVKDPGSFIAWLSARVKPGGYILVSFANRAARYRMMERLFKRCGFARKSYLALQESQFMLVEAKDLLHKHGLLPVDHRYFGMPSFLYWFLGEMEHPKWSTMFVVVARKL